MGNVAMVKTQAAIKATRSAAAKKAAGKVRRTKKAKRAGSPKPKKK